MPSFLTAQSTEADIKARLIGKPLYLRGFWKDDNLRFDSTGHLLGNSSTVSFALSGIDVQRVQVESDKLVLEGRRVGVWLSKDKQGRIPLDIGKLRFHKDERVLIEIAANSAGDYSSALDGVLVEGLGNLTPLLPAYWQGYANANFHPAVPGRIPVRDEKTVHIDDTVLPPKLLKSTEPKFSDAARKLGYDGKVRIHFFLKPDGTVDDPSIIQGLGLGLDEQAVAVVEQYKFFPAMKDGHPVLVEVNIEVNFQIF